MHPNMHCGQLLSLSRHGCLPAGTQAGELAVCACVSFPIEATKLGKTLFFKFCCCKICNYTGNKTPEHKPRQTKTRHGCTSSPTSFTCFKVSILDKPMCARSDKHIAINCQLTRSCASWQAFRASRDLAAAMHLWLSISIKFEK
jgi:hypothetical protein